MGSRRILVGRQFLQEVANTTAVATAAHQLIPTWVVIAVASAVGLVAGLLLLVLILIILREKNGKSQGEGSGKGVPGIGVNSSSDTSKDLLPIRRSSSLHAREEDGWPFCVSPPETVESKMRAFSMAEVRRATDDFSEEGLLGEGRYGGVFKGTLDNGMQVAVKRMRVEHVHGEITRFGNRAEREFLAEAKVIVRVHHRHLLPVIGHCSTRDERILILVYMEKGTLEARLQDRTDVLDWSSRMRIAIGTAKGVAYLHEDCFPGIVHRDIKSSNILLDKFNEPRVADFGFARSKELGSRDPRRGFSSEAVHSQVVGTPGYLPLECILWGQSNSMKTDVYSFGVVLMELLSGRPPVIVSSEGQTETLAFVARECTDDGGGFEDMVDPALGSNYDPEEALRLWNIAMDCLCDEPSRRPRMGHVLLMLQGKHPARTPSPEDRLLNRFEHPLSRKPSPLAHEMDLWSRTTDSARTSRDAVPGRMSLQGTLDGADPRSSAEGSMTDKVGLSSEDLIPAHRRSRSDYERLSTSKFETSSQEEAGRESANLEAFESYLLQAEKATSLQYENGVQNDALALSNLKPAPNRTQGRRFPKREIPGLETWLAKRNRQAKPACPLFGERDGKIVSLEGSDQLEGLRSKSAERDNSAGRSTWDRSTRIVRQPLERVGVLSFIVKPGEERTGTMDADVLSVKSNPLFGVKKPRTDSPPAENAQARSGDKPGDHLSGVTTSPSTGMQYPLPDQIPPPSFLNSAGP